MHAICHCYGWAEEYVLWHDWAWINRKLERLGKSDLQQKRWMLMCMAAGPAIAFGGEEASGPYHELLATTYTPEERVAQIEAEEAEALRQLEEDRAWRTAQLQGTSGALLGA